MTVGAFDAAPLVHVLNECDRQIAHSLGLPLAVAPAGARAVGEVLAAAHRQAVADVARRIQRGIGAQIVASRRERRVRESQQRRWRKRLRKHQRRLRAYAAMDVRGAIRNLTQEIRDGEAGWDARGQR